MIQIIALSDRQKLKMYMKHPKNKLAKMLIECNRLLGTQSKYFESKVILEKKK